MMWICRSCKAALRHASELAVRGDYVDADIVTQQDEDFRDANEGGKKHVHAEVAQRSARKFKKALPRGEKSRRAQLGKALNPKPINPMLLGIFH